MGNLLVHEGSRHPAAGPESMVRIGLRITSSMFMTPIAAHDHEGNGDPRFFHRLLSQEAASIIFGRMLALITAVLVRVFKP